MKVLLLTRYSRKGASSRLRSMQYVEALAITGMELHVHPLLDDAYLEAIHNKRKVTLWSLLRAYARRVGVLMKADEYDLVWFEKELFPNCPAFFEWLLARRGMRYVVDYDDAIFHNYGMSHNPIKRLMSNKIASVMRHAALVIGGNDYLLDYARRAGAQHTALLPTVIDLRRYGMTVPKRRSRQVIGWIGSPSTVKHLEALLPTLDRIARRFPVEVIVIGATVDTSAYPFVRCFPWKEEEEVRRIADFDIGIMPLLDGPWERGKCGYKLIQYMACAKPVVASPIGVNNQIVQVGRNGLLASSPDEWFDALAMLLQDADLRETMGWQGRCMVERQYCLQVTAPRMLGLLRSVVQEMGPGRGRQTQEARAQ